MSGGLVPMVSVVERITAYYLESRSLAEGAVLAAIRCGGELEEQKAKMKRGEWGPWIEANFPFSVQTARTYIRAAKARSESMLSFSSVRQLLASVAPPADSGAKPKPAKVSTKRTGKLAVELDDARADVTRMEDEVSRLESEGNRLLEENQRLRAELERVTAERDALLLEREEFRKQSMTPAGGRQVDIEEQIAAAVKAEPKPKRSRSKAANAERAEIDAHHRQALADRANGASL